MKSEFSDTIQFEHIEDGNDGAVTYKGFLEEALVSGDIPHFPELEVFGSGHVDVEAISLFMNELVDFIYEREMQSEDDATLQALHHLARLIQMEYFGGSPSMMNYIPMEDRLDYLAKATRSQIIQGTFGGSIVGETVYDISFMRGNFSDVALKSIERASVPEQLDILHQLQSIAAQAVANGTWSRSCYEEVHETYKAVIGDESDYSVITQLAAKLGLSVIEAEFEDPQLSVVRFQGQTNDSRLNSYRSDEQIESDTNKFFRNYKVEDSITPGARLLRAARDKDILVDKTGLAFAVVDKAIFSDDELEFSITKYEQLKNILENQNNYDPSTVDGIWSQLFSEVRDRMIGDYFDEGNFEACAEIFHSMFSFASKEDWENYFEVQFKSTKLKSQNQYYQEAGRKNEQITSDFIESILALPIPDVEILVAEFQDLRDSYESGDLDMAMDHASRIASAAHFNPDQFDNASAWGDLFEGLQNAHQQSFRDAEIEFKDQIDAWENLPEVKAASAVSDSLQQNIVGVKQKLQNFLDEELERAADIPIARVTKIHKFFNSSGDERLSNDNTLLFQHIHSSDLGALIAEEFNLDLPSLSVAEQIYFLNYLKNITVADAEEFESFTKRYGADGMRTFFSLERGTEDLGDKIVAFGQHEEVAGEVFKYYCELLDIAEDAERLVKENTDCQGDLCIQYTNQVRENILNRAQKDLERAVRSDDISQIENLLGTYVAEAKEHVAILQELGVKQTEVVSAAELSDEDKEQMLTLLEQNYRGAYASEEESSFRETIRSSLEKSFGKSNTEFHILRHKEKIISFNRFDNTTSGEGRKASYFGSFNADPIYSGVGGVMLERTIQEQLEKCDVMYAHCDPASDISKKYIESGFVAKETETVAGKFSFEIWRTKDIAEHLRSRQMSTEELITGNFQEENIIVREVSETDSFEELDEGLGYLLTRYFKHDDKTYAVFEIPSPTLWNQFQA